MIRKSFFIYRFLLLLTVFLGWGIVFSPAAPAQGLIETMTEQIARLEIILQEAKQGYNIVHSGLSTISSIKKGDFDLHSLFFNSLMTVNPAIKGYGEIADIVAMQVQIISNTKQYLSLFTSATVFAPAELAYIAAVFSNLTDLTGTDIDELTGLITDGTWQMTDDERLGRIDLLFKKVSEKYNFLKSFGSSMKMEALRRQNTISSFQSLSKLILP